MNKSRNIKNQHQKRHEAHHTLASRAIFAGAILLSATLSAAPSNRRVVIGNDGKLEGVVSGYAWVAGGEGTSVAAPSPCNNSGCFRNTGGKLCTKGTIVPLICSGQGTPAYTCNWAKDWGVVLGFNTTEPAGPWGDIAPRSLAVEYTSVAHAGSAGHFRLTAHVVGDPDSKQYCVDYYTSGAEVHASDMKAQCWFGGGETLPNFKQVDKMGLLRLSESAPVAFDFCVTSISTE